MRETQLCWALCVHITRDIPSKELKAWQNLEETEKFYSLLRVGELWDTVTFMKRKARKPTLLGVPTASNGVGGSQQESGKLHLCTGSSSQ